MSTGAGAGDDRGSPDTPWGTGLVLSGARLFDGREVDVRLAGERIEAVGTVGSLRAPERIDLTGYLLLPAPAEPHAHLDEAFSAELGPPPRQSEELRRRMTEAALTYLGYGATALRTHVRLDEETGATRFDAAMQVSRDLRGLMDIQVAPMPGRLGGKDGREARALLRHALRSGAHALGGRPNIGKDYRAELTALIAFAGESGRQLDLHIQNLPGSLITSTPPDTLLCIGGSITRYELKRVAEHGKYGVILLPQSGRCTGLGHGEPDGSRASGVPFSLSHLVDGVAQAGLGYAAGGGALRDPACPTGRADPLEAAFILSTLGHPATVCYGAISVRSRLLLGLPEPKIEAGHPAELLAVRGDSLAAVLAGGHSRVVIHKGRVVSRTSAVREYADVTAPAVPRQVRPTPT